MVCSHASVGHLREVYQDVSGCFASSCFPSSCSFALSSLSLAFPLHLALLRCLLFSSSSPSVALARPLSLLPSSSFFLLSLVCASSSSSFLFLCFFPFPFPFPCHLFLSSLLLLPLLYSASHSSSLVPFPKAERSCTRSRTAVFLLTKRSSKVRNSARISGRRIRRLRRCETLARSS